VNIVHAVMAPVMALIRANLTPRGASASLPTAEALADGYLNAGGQDVSQSIQSTFALLHQSHPAVSGLYREWKLWEQMPADQSASDLRRGLATTIERQRAALQSTSGSRGGWLWPLRWLLTIGAVFWFPIVQPLLEAFLQLGADPGRFVSGIALLLVRIFGVTFLLKNAGFLLLYFLVLWVVLRWDTQRRVSRRMTRWQAADMTEPSLSLPAQAIEWIDGLIQPIRDARERADALDQRIAALRSSLREDAAA
ncbi:MAG: hypothetical protein ACRD15_03620, partial [Vicinamibacterales bacterium]